MALDYEVREDQYLLPQDAPAFTTDVSLEERSRYGLGDRLSNTAQNALVIPRLIGRALVMPLVVLVERAREQ